MSSCPSATPNVSLVDAPWEDAPTRNSEHSAIHCAWPESMIPHDNGPLHTLDETAAHLGATRESIRQTEIAAFRKLAKNPFLREYALERGYAPDRRTADLTNQRRQRYITWRGRRPYDNNTKETTQ